MQENLYRSPVFDLLQTSITFGLHNYAKVFIRDGCNVSKAKWKEVVCVRAWDLESVYWYLAITSSY